MRASTCMTLLNAVALERAFADIVANSHGSAQRVYEVVPRGALGFACRVHVRARVLSLVDDARVRV